MKTFTLIILLTAQLAFGAPTPTPAPSVIINLNVVLMVVPKADGTYSVEYENDYCTLVKTNPLDATVLSTKGGTWVKLELVP